MIRSKSIAKLACNITPVLILRLMFGLYFNFGFVKLICVIYRLFCFCFATSLVTLIYHQDQSATSFLKIWVIVTYVVYFLLSFWGIDHFLVEYFEFNPTIDGLPTSKPLLRKFGIVFNDVVITITCLKMISLISFYFSQPLLFSDNNLITVLGYFTLYAAVFVAQVTPALVFGLLHCRVKAIRILFETKGFENSPEYRLTPTKYMQMYTNIINDLETVDTSIKLSVFLAFLSITPSILQALYVLLADMKEYGLEPTKLALFTVFNFTRVLSLVAPVLYVDLVTDEIQNIKVCLLEKRIFSKHERLRAEIQEVLDYINNQPLQFDIWFFTSMNLRTIVVSTSFCVSTLMAILQINYNLTTPS